MFPKPSRVPLNVCYSSPQLSKSDFPTLPPGAPNSHCTPMSRHLSLNTSNKVTPSPQKCPSLFSTVIYTMISARPWCSFSVILGFYLSPPGSAHQPDLSVWPPECFSHLCHHEPSSSLPLRPEENTSRVCLPPRLSSQILFLYRLQSDALKLGPTVSRSPFFSPLKSIRK